MCRSARLCSVGHVAASRSAERLRARASCGASASRQRPHWRASATRRAVCSGCPSSGGQLTAGCSWEAARARCLRGPACAAPGVPGLRGTGLRPVPPPSVCSGFSRRAVRAHRSASGQNQLHQPSVFATVNTVNSSSCSSAREALPNPSLERGPPPAWRREALSVYDPPRGAIPAASAQLKR